VVSSEAKVSRKSDKESHKGKEKKKKEKEKWWK